SLIPNDPIKKGAPEWSVAPIRNIVNQIHRQGQLLDICRSGISILRGTPKLIEVLSKIHVAGEPNTKLEQAQKEAELAQREVDEGFPLLVSQATVTLWSTLEAGIRLLVVRWMQNQPNSLQNEAIQK